MKERIRKLRRTLDLTQQGFADEIGIKQNTVATYEMGKIEPSNSIVSLICQKWDVNETWLRTGEGKMFIEISRDERTAAFIGSVLRDESDSFRRRFVAMLAELDDSEWDLLEKIVIKLNVD